MLGRPISDISPSTASKPVKLSAGDDETYTGDCLIRPVAAGSDASQIWRAIIILTKAVTLTIPGGTAQSESSEDTPHDHKASQAENALFVISPGSLGEDLPPSPVTILMAGEGTFSAPAGQCKTSLKSLLVPSTDFVL